MGLAQKSSSFSSTSSSNNNEGNWGMGLLLVFFHHNPHHVDDNEDSSSPYNTTRRPSLLYNGNNNSNNKNNTSALISKAQSTLSICGVMLFTTLLLFTVSTFEPSAASTAAMYHRGNRRVLRENDGNGHGSFGGLGLFGRRGEGKMGNLMLVHALQGMGRLYTRGSKGMTDLVVGHVAEGATEGEVRSFMRLLHHSGVLARSDLVFVFDSVDSVSRLSDVVNSESELFVRMMGMLKRDVNGSGPGHGLTRYMRPVGGEKEAMWGKKGNWSNSGELAQRSYGSVVGFDSSELDPEDSLSGFLNRVPMGLRRWACYPMLLGRVRRYYKHTMLLDVRNSLVLSDPFGPVRNRSSESVFLWSESETELTRLHGRRSSPGSGTRVHPGVIVGGSRGIRRFANAALTEIVRAVVEHKGKGARNSVTEAGLVNQLVHSSHLPKNVILKTLTESIPKVSSLAGFNSLDSVESRLLAFGDYFSVVQRGHTSDNNIDIDYVVNKELCSSHQLYSTVYRDCLAGQ